MAERASEHRIVAGALYVLSWATLAFVGRSLGVAAGEADALEAALGAARALGHLVGAAPTTTIGPAAPGAATPIGPAAIAAGLGLLVGGRSTDALTAMRLGLATITALAPPLVFLLARRAIGAGPAALAALLTLFHPRWLLGASALHGEGVLAAGIMATLWAYARLLEWPVRRRAAPLGLAFGAALLASPVALMLPAAVVMQGAWPASLLRTGRVDSRWKRLALALVAMGLGAGLLLGLQIAAARALGLSPLLWAAERSTPRPGTPTLGTAQALALPWICAPASTAVLGLAGAATFLWLAWRFPARARPLVATAAVGAFLAARPLTWPAPHALGLDGALPPIVGVFAALGVRAVGSALAARTAGERGRSLRVVALALVLGGPWWASLAGPATLSASYSTLAGGPGRVARSGALPLHDGSPLGGLAEAIDGLGRDDLAVYAPGVPDEIWAWMHRLGRLRTRVYGVPDRARAEIEVATGGEPPEGAVALVRGAQAIVSLRTLGAPPAAAREAPEPATGGAPSSSPDEVGATPPSP